MFLDELVTVKKKRTQSRVIAGQIILAVAFLLSLYSVVAFALLYESVMTPKIVGQRL